MDYLQAVAYHEDAKVYGSILGLGSIRSLMGELGDVWRDLKIVHVAGTNGKGSVCCFLSSIFREAGYRVGQFSSPAVFDLREVYQVDGRWIGKEAYASCMERVAAACKSMCNKGLRHPTVFEVDTALAFLWFSQMKCDIVLLETGMGGGTDATNIIQEPLCSVVTSIGMDHMEFLGSSLAEIARAKAGIIKDGCPVVTAVQPEEAQGVLEDAAKKHGAICRRAAKINDWLIEGDKLYYLHPAFGEVCLSMTGAYQADNSSLALEAAFLLKTDYRRLTSDAIRRGLQTAMIPGRFERLCLEPEIYLDGAHNVDAAKKLRMTLEHNLAGKHRIGIMGVMADKCYGEMVDRLHGMFQEIYTVTPRNPRALPAEKLAEEIKKRQGRAKSYTEIEKAVRDAVVMAKEEKDGCVVVVFGSLYYLREVRQAVYEMEKHR